MATIEHSEIVKASPERVFDLLRRVEDFADYSDLIRSIDSLGGEPLPLARKGGGDGLGIRCGGD